jgi:hypothetical protein
MDIIVKKADDADKERMRSKPVWGCGISEFDWHYDSKETCLVTEGEVEVLYNGNSVQITAGDYVVFPKGLSCVWKVSKAVKKHYEFG